MNTLEGNNVKQAIDHSDLVHRYSIMDTPRIAIEAAGLGTWIIDIESRLFIPSPRMKELYGYLPDEEMSYDDLLNQITDKFRDKVKVSLEATITNRGNYSMEYPVLGFHDQKLRWVKVLGAVTDEPTFHLSYLSGVIMDITEQKEEQLRRGKFIGIVSHELKTPLTTLKAYVQMLNGWAKKRKDSFSLGTLSKVERQVKKMTSMINGFLQLSQADSGNIQLNLLEFKLNELINEVIEETNLISPGYTIILEPCETLTIYADRDKIDQVLINLLTNAVKYSSNIKPIEMFCKLIENNVQVGVKDYGMGIRKDEIEKLFNRNYRVKSDKTKNIPGFGFGLYLCAEIIKKHNGRLWVESEEGKGSTFYFTLPQRTA
jgi:PAS domain S-box-containing protein